MNTQFIYILKILLATALAYFIGLERERSHKEAGLRTILLIALGTVSFTIMPFILAETALNLKIHFDFSRIPAYTISGIGFLAGIVIIKGKKQIEGITTAASIWAVVSMGMLVGLGSYYLAVLIACLIILILKLKLYKIKMERKKCKKILMK